MLQTRWSCGFCGKAFVVPSLARDCEEKHLDYTEKQYGIGDH